MALEQELEKLFFNFSDREYWFIRTFGGSFYDDFVRFGFIAIDNDGLRYQDIVNAKKNETKNNPSQKILGDLIKKRNPNAKFYQVHAKALIDFCYNIKKNDLVFIPDDYGALTFGIVQDKAINLDMKRDDQVPYNFRRKIKWVERRRKRELDAKMWPLFNSQKTVNNASKYAEYINPSLNTLYKNGALSYLSLDVLTSNPIDARSFFTLGNDILDISEEINKYFKINSDNKVDVKLELKSPGSIELIALGMFGLAALGLIIIGLSGGKWKFNLKSKTFEFQGDMETDGVIDKLSDFMNDGTDRQGKLLEIQNKLQQIQVTDKKGDISKALGQGQVTEPTEPYKLEPGKPDVLRIENKKGEEKEGDTNNAEKNK